MARSRALSFTLVAILLVGFAVRLAYVYRPLDHRLVNPWRQSDYYQIARNFFRDGPNILYPRIDWRGDQPGYAEMEFPLTPWLGSVMFHVWGMHVQVMRALVATLSCATLILFAWFAYAVLPASGALAATVAFAFNPLLVVLASTLQPEPLLLLCSLATVVLIWRWRERPDFRTLLAASAMLALAILAKAPAVFLGIVVAGVIIERLGRRAFFDPRVYVAALVALVPPLAWYTWAHHFWAAYGLSLGVSNESHAIGWDMLWPPKFLLGIVTWETLGVLTPAGWLLALAGLRLRSPSVRLFVVWYAAAFLFYILAGRTTGDRWAYYYHSISVMPACLLMGAGCAALLNGDVAFGRFTWSVSTQRRLAAGLATVTLLGFIAATAFLLHRRDARADLLVQRRCALEFLPHVPPAERIVILGGNMFDEYGHPVAHNESMVFAWMDRKGFNYGEEERSLETLDAIAARGGRYWIVQQRELDTSRLGGVVDSRYRHIASCADTYHLYDLRPR